jgi:four helix bundle protein
VQDFNNVRAWKKAHALAIVVHGLVSRFPRRGYSTLRRQMVRSSESIADRIAEGCGAATSLEFARFLDMAIKSTSELENQFKRAHGYGLLNPRRLNLFATDVQDIRKMTWSLRNSVLRSPDS